MKKFKIYILSLVLLSIFSCSDAIDIEQPGRFSADIAYSSVEDLGLGIFGAYNELDISNMMSFNATFTDEVAIGINNGGQAISDGRINYILDATSGIASSIWVNQYDAINFSTRLIEAASTITPESGEENIYDAILGQAYCIRAWAHFILFSYYTTDYTDDNALCVIKVDFVPSVGDELGRNTNGEIIDLITNDLNRAESLITPFFSDPNFMSQDFITALRARMAAYREDYAAAATFAKELSDKYPLADQTQYFNMYEDTDNTEVIYKMDRTVNDDYDGQGGSGGGWAGSIFAFTASDFTGGPFLEMSRSLYNSFDSGDIRLERALDPTSKVDPNYQTNPNFENDDVLVIRKYPGSDGQNLMNDLKVFRASEMVLIEAEAAIAMGDLDGAAGFMKEIKDARFGNDTQLLSFSDATEAYGALLDERRLEFCYEGHRYLDLKRLGVRANRDIDRDLVDCAPYGACSDSNFYPTSSRVNANSYKFSLPIPLVEQNGNSVIRDQQNPGY